MDKPRCAVKGQLGPGLICGRVVIGGEFCGSAAPCGYKVVKLKPLDGYSVPIKPASAGEIAAYMEPAPTVTVPAITDERRNIRHVEQHGDFAVTVVFTSCRAASAFKRWLAQPPVIEVLAEARLFEAHMREHHPAFPLKRITYRDGSIAFQGAGTQHMWRGWCAAKGVKP